MNKQEQREISCIGSASVGIQAVRSISSVWILINWLREWDELLRVDFYPEVDFTGYQTSISSLNGLSLHATTQR